MERVGKSGGNTLLEVGVMPAFLPLRGLSYRRRPGPLWTSRAGVRVTSTEDGGLPAYSIDRLVFTYFATKAHRQGRVIHGTCHELTRMFQLSWSRAATLRRVRRVAFSCTEAPSHGPGCPCTCALMAQRAIVAESVDSRRGSDSFTVRLTEAFMREVEHGAPISLAAAARFAGKCAVFDYYGFLALRAPEPRRFPVDGPQWPCRGQ